MSKSMLHTQGAVIPAPPVLISSDKPEDIKKDLDTLKSYLGELTAAIGNISDDIYHDLALGKSRHEVRTTAPSADDMDVGAVQVYRAGAGVGQTFLYTRTVDGVKYFTSTN